MASVAASIVVQDFKTAGGKYDVALSCHVTECSLLNLKYFRGIIKTHLASFQSHHTILNKEAKNFSGDFWNFMMHLVGKINTLD